MTARCLLGVIIPSYDRPELLEIALKSWIRTKIVNKIIVIVQGSNEDMLRKYKQIIEKYSNSNLIVYEFFEDRIGSIKARNHGLRLALKYDCKYYIMTEDDIVFYEKKFLFRMIKEFELNKEIGLIGGKIISFDNRKTDPDFFLNLPFNFADYLTKITGYIFIDIKNGPRYADFLPGFFMMSRDIINKKVRYDGVYDSLTNFREESDFQNQVKQLGYKLLYDPKIYVIHLASDEGGNRSKISMEKRIYLKARNHTIFTLKWNSSLFRIIWYIFVLIMILSIYRPNHFFQVLKGVRDGFCYLKSKWNLFWK